jgi:hypothetical protein
MIDEEFLSAVTAFELLNSIRNGLIPPSEAKLLPVLVGGSVSFSVTNDGICLKQSRVPLDSWLKDVREILNLCGEITLMCFERNMEVKKSMKKSRSAGDKAVMVPFLTPCWKMRICRSEKEVHQFLKMYNSKAYKVLFREEEEMTPCCCLKIFHTTTNVLQ